MELKAHWKTEVISPEQRNRAEREMEEFLIDHFGGASNAFNAKVSFSQCHCPPNHPWNIAIIKGIDLCTRGILPSVKSDRHWEVKFYD